MAAKILDLHQLLTTQTLPYFDTSEFTISELLGLSYPKLHAEWKQAPNSARKWKWDLSKLASDPALRDKFLAEVETPLAQCAGRWKHLGTGAATQGQVDQAVEELKGVLMARA